MSIEETIQILTRTPVALAAMLSGTSEYWNRATEGEGTWSPYDVVGHLVHGEKTDWIPRLKHIVAGNSGAFEPFDRTAQFHESEGKSIEDLLGDFAKLRGESIGAVIALGLTETDLAREGEHPELGRVTLGQLLATWVVHDLDHIAQIARVMAKVNTDAVGPWRAYLSILEDRK